MISWSAVKLIGLHLEDYQVRYRRHHSGGLVPGLSEMIEIVSETVLAAFEECVVAVRNG